MKMNKIAFVVISALCVFTLFSCTDLLTKPLLEQIGLGDVLQYAPDAESLSSADTTTLANAAGDISIAADPVASKAVLEALSAKVANNQNALDDLNKPENKTLRNNVLSLTTATVLPIDEIVQVAVNAMNDEDNSDNDDQTQAVIEQMLGSVQFVDTRATEEILKKRTVTSNTNTITSDEASTILLATISVAISACKSSPMVDLGSTQGQQAMENLMNTLDQNTSNPGQTATTILTNLSASGTANPDGVRALTSAITVLSNLKQRTDVTVSTGSIMEMFTAGMGND